MIYVATLPITRARREIRKLLRLLRYGAVLITRRGKPHAVILAPTDFNGLLE